jgi:DNA uptake protein ComE-like DNA-binding protein
VTLQSRRAFATFMVLWAVALAAIVLVALQSISHKQASQGRLALARVRAYWAARGAIEAQIAVLTADTLSPDESSAFTLEYDLANAARGELRLASYSVVHSRYPDTRDGALDAHSRININTMSKESMLLLPDMDEATADAVTDWIDDDDEPEEFGAEEGQYLSQKFPYSPRNAPMRSLREVELVIGVNPEYVRGEDWNLNGLLDLDENDGELSWPRDSADGRLDAGWSQYLTAVSDGGAGPGYSLTGQPRLDLETATADDIARRLLIDTAQAEAIVNHVTGGGSITDFIDSTLSRLAAGAGAATPLTGQQGGGGGSQVADLTDEQLGKLLDECYVPGDSLGPRTGKVNINTVDEKTLEYLAELEPTIAETLITERNARSGGFVRLVDLLEVPSITREVLATLHPYLDVRSQTFVAVARGRDEPSGVEVEIQAVLDRSTIPVLIRDLIVR